MPTLPFAPTAPSALWALSVLLALLATSASLLLPSVASAADFTWSGGGEAAFMADNWSDGANWLGGTAPASSSSIEALAFPALTSSSCGSPPADVCYESNNNLSNLSVNSIAIDDVVPYTINGNAITLGSGGITATAAATASSSLPLLNLPITLGTPQTWAIEGGSLSVGQVTGTTDALNIDLSGGSTLAFFDSENEAGALTIAGDNPSNIGARADFNGSVVVGVPTSTAGLNSTDGQPISLNDAEIVAIYASTIGPLTSTGGAVVASEGSSLTVNGAMTLDPTSVVELLISRAGSTPSTDYSQLKASGAINLAGASLSLTGFAPSGPSGESCAVLNPGDVDTLVTTTGSLEGAFASIPNGSVIPLSCTPGEPATVRINYTAHAVTATVIQAGSSSSPSGGGGGGGGGSSTGGSSDSSSSGSSPSTGGSSTGSSGGSTTTATITISSAQVAALLGQQLIPSGKAAKIGALLKAGGLTMSFKALEAGTLSVAWYAAPNGAKVAKKGKAKPVLVASGQASFAGAGTSKVNVRLTAAGRKLLKGAKRVKLMARGTFATKEESSVSEAKTIVLRG
jgi:hypothetical protein